MTVRGHINYVAPPDTAVRELRRAVNDGLKKSVEYWHDEYLPGHFERSAHSKYGYQARKQKWIIRKLRKTGQANDLVFTGRLKREAMRAIRITGTSKRATGTMDVPKYTYTYKPGQPKKQEELVAITSAEADDLAQQLDQIIQTAFDSNRESRTVNV